MKNESNKLKFWEYAYGSINEMNQASTALSEEYKECFLIYAENENEAFMLALKHIYENKPMVTLHDIWYKGEHYDTVKNVVCKTEDDIMAERLKEQRLKEESEEKIRILQEHLESNNINIVQFFRTLLFIKTIEPNDLELYMSAGLNGKLKKQNES